jgi:hypothetical protein
VVLGEFLPQKKIKSYGAVGRFDSLNTRRRKQEEDRVQELLQGDGSVSQNDEKLYKVKGQGQK